MKLHFLNKIKFEYKITIVYLVLGFLWIFFSDRLLDYFIKDNYLLSKFQTFKGSFYILVTAILLFYLVSRHIRNLKKAENKHKESEDRYKSLFFKNNSVMLLVDPETLLIADANDAALEYYGYSHKELTSLTINKINIYSFEEIKNIVDNLSDRSYFNFKHKLKSGEIRDVEVYTGEIQFDKKTYIYSIIHDITDKKKNEIELQEKNKEYAALNEEYQSINEDLLQSNLTLIETNEKLIHSEAQFRMLVDNAPEPIFIQTEEKFAYLNKAAIKLYGAVDEEQLIGTFVIARVHADYVEIGKQRIKKLNENRESAELIYYKHLKLDNTPIDVEVSGVPFTYMNKKGALVFVRDITERLQQNLELIHAKEKAEESDSLKSAFLQNISHEVRTPLNAIVGFSQLITSPQQSPDKYSMYAQLIANSSEKLIEIITDVIEISQIQAQQSKAFLNELEIVSMVTQIVNELRKKAEIKNISFHVETNFPYNEYFIKSDSDKIKRILTHLIDNAIKFTIKGGIEIKCKLLSDTLIFSVTDTGIGISDDMQKVIFEPFRQVETKISRNFGGNGLGLTIVKAYTALLNGTIALQSEINKGTNITVSIPVVGGSRRLTEQDTLLRTHAASTILIAEDEYSNYQYLEAILEETKLKILYAENGQKAVDMCRNNSEIDLILMDIKMPVMDGQTAAGLIKAFRPNLPIIAQTAYALDHEIENYIGNEFNDYITKPIRAEDLKRKMLKYL